MARSPRFRISRLGELLRQISFASDDALRRQLHAAEILLDELESTQTYEAGSVIHRITGFRPEVEPADGGELLVGEALIEDLTTFILRLSLATDLHPDERPDGAETAEALAARLGVTQRTIQRWRRLGLALHWIDFEGRRRVGCYRSALESFLRRRPEQRRGRPLVRLDPSEQSLLIAEARAVRSAGGGSLSHVAEQVARRHGRAHETVRQLLIRHDARSTEPIFVGTEADRAPLDERGRRFIERAWRSGVPLGRIAARLRRSLPAIHRQLMIRRRERLIGLRIGWIELPTFELPGADEIILAPPQVRSGLRRLGSEPDMLAMIASLREAVPADAPDRRVVAAGPRQTRRRRSAAEERHADAAAESDVAAAVEDLLLAAWNFLKRRAARRIASLEQVPPAGAIDAVERDLRWASLVQQTLVGSALGEAIRRADLWAGRRVEGLPAEEIRDLLRLLVPVCAEAIDRVDSSRGHRLRRVVALEVDWTLARRGPSGAGPQGERTTGRLRATAGHLGGLAGPQDLFDRLSPWQAWLDPPKGWQARLPRLPEAQRQAVSAMLGLDGAAPRSMSEIARLMRIGPSAAARLAAEGEAGLRGWGLAGGPQRSGSG